MSIDQPIYTSALVLLIKTLFIHSVRPKEMKIFMRIKNEFKKPCMNQNWIDMSETGKREQKQNGESGLSRRGMSLMRKFPGNPMLEKVHGGKDKGIRVGIQWITLLGGNWFYYWKWRHFMEEDCIPSDFWGSHGLQLTRLLCPWDFPGQNTGVGSLSFL